MKKLLWLVAITVAGLAQSVSAEEIHSVWTCSRARQAPKVLGVLKNDAFNSEYWLVLADLDGSAAQEWLTDKTWLPTQPKTELTGANSKSTLTLTIKEKDAKLNARVKQHEGGLVSYGCSKDETDQVFRAVKQAAAGFTKKWEATDAITSPRTLSDFKSMLRLTRRRVGVIASDDVLHHLPLAVPNLTVDLNWDETPSDANLKSASIATIAKHLKIKKWDDEKDVLTGEDNPDGKVYRFYRKDAQAFTERPFGLGAAKFVRYEIVEASTFPCEDFYVDHESYVWVLVDGSTFSYSPQLECD